MQSEGGPGDDPWIGRTLGNGYEIVEQIAAGGMGLIYRANQTALDRPVAVKFLHAHLAAHPTALDRFYLEARTASRLDHPNSVAIIDFGVTTPESVPYLVMEYIVGEDLSKVVRAGALPIRRACGIVLDVLAALAEAHELGIVHRDLKPENVLIVHRRGRDQVKVVDFGIAQMLEERPAGRRPTQQEGAMVGTPEYAAPEQLRGEPCDRRTDLYSTGVLLFELLTGRIPFEGKSIHEIAWKQMADEPPDPREDVPEIPDALANVVLRAMSKKPDARFASAEEMAREIRKAIDDPTAAAVAPVSAPAPSSEKRRSLRPSAPAIDVPAPEPKEVFAAEGTELDQLDAWRLGDDRDAVLAAVIGGPASGKSWLLENLAARARNDGDVVVQTDAHPLRAPVPYWALRKLHAGLWRAAGKPREPGPLERAGIEEMERAVGLRGRDGTSRAGAVAAAIGAAVEAAGARAATKRVVILGDDVCDWDDLSRQALARVPARVTGTRLRIAISTSRDAALSRFGAAKRIVIGRKIPGEALAEAVLQRLDALDADARHALQAACALGDEAPLEGVAAVAGRATDEHAGARAADLSAGSVIERLRQSGLADTYARGALAVHPFVRDVIESSMPLELRRAMHRRALEWHRRRGSPIEVLAEHAARGADPPDAVSLLERMGEAALRAGDASAAASAYERALAIARQELGRTGRDEWERATVRCGRGLGEARRRDGQLAQSEAVLLETMPQCTVAAERAAHRIALARVADRRGRTEEAWELLEEARALVGEVGDASIAVEADLVRAEMLRDRSDFAGAAAALRRAARRADDPADPERAARVAVELGEVELALDLAQDAMESFARAVWLARDARSGSLEAAAIAGIAEIDRRAGRQREATAGIEEAAKRAAEAGDLEGWLRWTARAAQQRSA